MATLRPPSAELPARAAVRWTSLTKIILQPEQNWPTDICQDPIITGRVGSRTVALIADPEAAKLILSDPEVRFPKWRFYQHIAGAGTGPDAISIVTGTQWGRQRRAFNPIFSPATASQLVPLFHEVAARAIARWKSQQSSPTIDISLEMTRLIIEVIWRVLFGRQGSDPPSIVDRAAAQIHDAHSRNAINLLPRILAELADAAEQRPAGRDLIADNPFASWTASSNQSPHGGRLSHSELYDNARGFMFAGHETTALTLTWAMWLVAQDLETQQQLHEEIDRVIGKDQIEDTHTGQLVFLQQVLRETLRLFPPGFVMARQAMEPVALAGVRLPAKAVLVICIYALHRHRDWWHDPDMFVPKRFGAGEPRHRHAYLPFSAGARACIGTALAWKELVTIFATMLQHFRVSTETVVIKPRFALTLHPDRPVPITLHSR